MSKLRENIGLDIFSGFRSNWNFIPEAVIRWFLAHCSLSQNWNWFRVLVLLVDENEVSETNIFKMMAVGIRLSLPLNEGITCNYQY